MGIETGFPVDETGVTVIDGVHDEPSETAKLDAVRPVMEVPSWFVTVTNVVIVPNELLSIWFIVRVSWLVVADLIVNTALLVSLAVFPTESVTITLTAAVVEGVFGTVHVYEPVF